MSRLIPLSVPNLKGNELKYVSKAIEAEWVSTGGGYIDEFERNIAAYLKVESATSCQSGTAGLHLALQLAGVEHSHEVIVPTLTFIAAVNPIRYIGAEPVFMDCDDSLNMDLNKLESFCGEECVLTEHGLMNNLTNKIIKAIVIVHVFGNMVNMERLMDIASRYHLKVVEDATEALGTYCTIGKYSGKFAGTIGDFGVYSFNGNKIITTGGGGMLVSNNPGMVEKARYLGTQAKDDPLYYIHHEVGYNYRMTNLQAALGVAQLEQLETFIHNKSRIYQRYHKNIPLIEGLTLCPYNEGTRPNYWLCSILVDPVAYTITRDELLKELNRYKIQSRPVWGLIHLQQPYRHSQAYRIERALEYSVGLLNIPSSSNLEIEDVDIIVTALSEIKTSRKEA